MFGEFWRVLESFGEFGNQHILKPMWLESFGEFWRVLESFIFGEFLKTFVLCIYIYEKLCFLRFYDPRVLESFGEFFEPTHFEINVVGEFWRVLESFLNQHILKPTWLESFGEFWRVLSRGMVFRLLSQICTRLGRPA